MEPGARYRPNSPPILQETVDDDTIIVDLDTGSYFHLTGAGAYAWRLMEAGASLDDVAGAFADVYAVNPKDAARDLDVLVGDLLAENLIVAAEANGTREVAAPRLTAYQPPALTKHIDMQELLLLDPVHDVDETGWPAAE